MKQVEMNPLDGRSVKMVSRFSEKGGFAQFSLGNHDEY
jgi:hypothetical protein